MYEMSDVTVSDGWDKTALKIIPKIFSSFQLVISTCHEPSVTFPHHFNSHPMRLRSIQMCECCNDRSSSVPKYAREK